MLKWKKLGNIFDPTKSSSRPWMQEYAQIPYPLLLNDDTLRVYFATRPKRDSDLNYISRSGFVDLNPENFELKSTALDPLFEIGTPGAFDEFGAMTSSIIEHNGKHFAYYTGWSRLETVPYTMANGLAISTDGGTKFERISEGPIMGATINEPYLLSGPIVKKIDGKWLMWYLNGLRWIQHDGKYEPVYKLAHASSQDGVNWQRDGKPVIPSLSKDECQVGFGLFEKDQKWHVIFAYRKPTEFREGGDGSYKLGYAWSSDLKSWTREDAQVGIELSETGWDSQMMAYPQVWKYKEKIFLFYCGNEFGRYGFGVAELIEIK